MAGEGGSLNLEQVKHALGDGAGININEAVYAAADGRVDQLSTALTRLQLDAVPGERLLRTAQSYFLKLYRITAAMDDGLARDQAMSSIRPPISFQKSELWKIICAYGHRHAAARRLTDWLMLKNNHGAVFRQTHQLLKP